MRPLVGDGEVLDLADGMVSAGRDVRFRVDTVVKLVGDLLSSVRL